MKSMSEDAVRAMLADIAGAPEPPSRISVETARKAGRRRQWAGRAIASAAAAVAVGGALIVPRLVVGTAPASAVRPAADATTAAPATSAARAKQPAPAPAPVRFSPLELPANFGWLPSFWNEEGATVELTATFAVVNLDDGQTLKVSPRGWYPDQSLYASTRGSFPGAATDPKAPPVNGQPAYWYDNGIMWQYAPGAWAYLYGAGNTDRSVGRTLDEEMARGVRFGSEPIYTPFRFNHAIPAGWAIIKTDSTLTHGRPLAWQLSIGPAVAPQALTISDDVGFGVCDLLPPQSTLTASGIQWDYYYTAEDQSICAVTRVDGRGYLNMYYYWRHHPHALNLASLVRSMTLLGPDPKRWSTNPLGG